MAMITPNDGKKIERDPEEGNFPTGVYACELTRVEEVGPGAKYPEGNNRLVFEFTVSDGQYKGKTALAFLGKTLHTSKDGRESNLVKWARMMGATNPQNGFDPDTLVGKRFQVMCEFTAGTGDMPGRAWARQAMAVAQTATTRPAAAPSGNGQAAQLWDYSYPVADGQKAAKGKQTTEQVVDFLTEFMDSGGDIATVRVRPAGTTTQPVTGDVWRKTYAPAPVDDGVIPF